VVSGFTGGITDFLKNSIDTVKKWAGSVVSAVKDKLGIHSPSKVFQTLGEYTVAGFNESIDKYGSTTGDVMQEWVDSFSDMSVSVGVGLSVDDSELSKLKNDYGFNRQMDINAMADYMNESLQTDDGSQAELLRAQNEKLDKQNELLQQILDKDISVSGDEVFSTVRRKANDYFRVNREPAFDF
jgi:phage-related protein